MTDIWQINKNKSICTALRHVVGSVLIFVFEDRYVTYMLSVCSWLCLTQVLVKDVNILPVLLKNLLDPEYPFSDQICTILSNLTRHKKTCKTVFKVMHLEMLPERFWLTELSRLHHISVRCWSHSGPQSLSGHRNKCSWLSPNQSAG